MDTRAPLIFVPMALDLDASGGTSYRFGIVDAGLPSFCLFFLFYHHTNVLLLWLVALLVRLLSPNEVLLAIFHQLPLAATQPVLAPFFFVLIPGLLSPSR